MAGLSTYAQEKFLNFMRGTAAGTAPAALYVGLFNGDPTDSGASGTEVTATIRPAGRVAAPFGAPATGAGTSTITNTGAVDFGTAAGAATVTHFGLFDAASSGNMYGSGTIASGSVALGNAVNFAIGDLTFSLS